MAELHAALTPDDLLAFLTAHGIPGEILHLSAQTPTVAAAAEALSVSVEQIVKTVLFLIDGKPYAVLANGVRRVDKRKLAAHFGVSPKRVKLAGGEEVLRLTGYAPGTVPPLGHSLPVERLIDPGVLNQATVYAGGGGIHAMLRITSADLFEATRPAVVDVLEESANLADNS
jgi:prolyl-tRNA editing enzyme YbaK/EbsC (Cys-tRNA(Pro) deacylase)